MAKRQADVEDGNFVQQKRQKILTSGNLSSKAEEINSARKLQQILAFDQDIGRLKHGKLSNINLGQFC
jgi:nucleolar pre-ribosomal-associated protein 1